MARSLKIPNSLSASPAQLAGKTDARVRFRPDVWSLLTLLIAGLVALPVITVLAHVFVPTGEVWSHLYQTVLRGYVLNTLGLMLGVGFGTLLIGVGTAWLVVMCRFPGRRIFEWALLLPLAVPTYVIAYA